MYALHPPAFAYCTNIGLGNPSASAGTALTNAVGASNADGSAVAIGSALTFDCEFLEIIVTTANGASAASVTAEDNAALLDILIDPAGGTSWDTTNRLITSLMIGCMPTANAGGSMTARVWKFPLWVPAGATFAGIGRTVRGGALSPTVFLRAWGGIRQPQHYWCGQKVDAIGEDRANSGGTAVAPSGTANTFGTLTNIGSATTRRYGALVPSVMLSTATQSGGTTRQFKTAIGSTTVGPTVNYHVVATEISSGAYEGGWPIIYADVPEGTQLQAQIATNSTASNNSDEMIIHGVAA